MEKLNNKEVVRIVNPKQCAFYISGGVKPLDLIVDENSGRLVFIFDKAETMPMWKEWRHTSYNPK